MSEGKGSRRAVAELRWEAGAEPVERVGGRSLHQYWPVLSPYFRDVLLPPVRRTDEDVVLWSWREPEGAKAVSAGELRALRKRLAGELELLAENLERAEVVSGTVEAQKSGGGIQGLAAVMAGVVERLVASSDPELAGYVARTEAGLRLHSWGAGAPARVQYPDTAGAGVADARVAVEEGRRRGRGMRRRKWAGLMMLGGVGAAVGLGSVIWNRADAPDSGSEANAETKVHREEMPGGPRAEPTADRRVAREMEGGGRLREDVARTGVSDDERMGKTAVTAERAVADAAGASETVSSRNRPMAQRPVAQEEPRGVPLAPNGRPDQENPASGGRAGGALREGDTEKPAEKRAEVGAASDEDAARKKVEEVRRDVPVRQRSEAAEPVGLKALEERKRAGELRPEDGETRETRGERRREESAAASGGVVAADLRTKRGEVSEIGWQREMIVRRPRWQTRLLVDAIVPTRPVRLGESSGAESLQERMLAEAGARMPATLRALRWREGVGFAGENSARWRGGNGGGSREQQAELEWGEQEGTWTLEDASGGVVAEVRTTAARDGWVILVREGVRVYQWFTVEIAAEERGARWSWRRVTAAELPAGVAIRGGDAGEMRVETAPALAEPLALFDRATGWAAVAEMSARR